MSYLHADSFDSYTSVVDLSRSYSVVGVSGVDIGIGVGRNGSNTLRLTNGNGHIGKGVNPLDAIAVTQFLHATSAVASYVLHSVFDGISGRQQVVYIVNADGSISAYRVTDNAALMAFAAGTLLGTTAAGIILPSVRQSFGFKTTVDGSAGTIDIWMDGTNRLSLTGKDTLNPGASGATYSLLAVGMGSSVATVDIDDLIMMDGDATDGLNTYLGDLAGEWSPVTANGASSGWTPLSGTNASNVDDPVPDDDLSYVSTGVTTTKDTYAHAPLVNIDGGIKLVQVVTVARKTGAGTRSIQHVVRSAGADHDSGTDLVLSTDYSRQVTARSKDPATGSDWSVSGANASEIGQKLTA